MNPKTKALLEYAYAEFHSQKRRLADPISIVHEYQHKQDQEVIALITAILAYGNVQTIKKSVKKVTAILGESPCLTLKSLRSWPEFSDFRHRFTTGADLQIVFHWIGTALNSHGSLEAFFNDHQYPPNAPLKDLLSGFVRRFKSQPLSKELERKARERERGLKYLISDPYQGSACKRLNMFLRWMVRKDEFIDLGLWQSPKKHQLMLPIDTHLLKTLHRLRWTRSKQATWRVVEEATKKLRLYDPEDPIRYDFALCHLSMSGGNIKQYSSDKHSTNLSEENHVSKME